MQKLFQIIDTSDWTIIVLFGVILMAIVATTEVLDKNKGKKDELIFVNGNWVHNDYDPIGFRILFAWCIFVGVCIGFVVYKYYTAK